jgi:uncharacterized damage-inducible protein DinB
MFSANELYTYSSSVRTKFLETLEQLPWAEVTRNREASFNSMRNIFVHMLEVEDWMVNWVVAERSEPYPWDKFEEYDSFAKMEQYLRRVELGTKRLLETSSQPQLERRVTLRLRSGDSFVLSVEECILQAFTEQLYHMGELIALFWQADVRPPRMQWFWNNPRESPK